MEETKNEMLNISREQLDAVVNDAVKKAMSNHGVPERQKRVMERILKVRFYNDKLVRKFGNVEEERNDRNKLVAYMDITLDGEDKPEKVEYLKFLDKTPQYRALIKKTDTKEIVETEDPNHDGGKFITENPDEAKIERKSFTPRVEVSEVTRRVKTYEVEMLEGPFVGKVFTIGDEEANK